MQAFAHAHTPSLPFQSADIPAITNIYKEWRTNLPPIETFVQGTIADTDFSNKTKSIIVAAAKLAAEPANEACLYHDNMHSLQVFSMTYTLGKQALDDGRINENTFGNMLAAALIHDYKHDGSKNDGDQFRLEKFSFESVKDSLQKAGATPEDLKMIKLFVLTTDVSKDFTNKNAISPAESLKNFVKDGIVDTVFEELKWLVENSTLDNNLVDAALTIQDADVGCSLLNMEACIYSSRQLAAERNIEYSVENDRFFINDVCHRTFSSISGLKTLQPYLMSTIQQFTTVYPNKKFERAPA